MKTVIKRDGREEEYAKEKIIVSCIKCGVPPETARVIAAKVEEQLEFPVKSEHILELVLKELSHYDKQWAENWAIYDRAVKKRETKINA